MLDPGIEAQRVNLTHLAFGETRGALDILLGHGIGVRIARLADVIEQEFHAATVTLCGRTESRCGPQRNPRDRRCLPAHPQCAPSGRSLLRAALLSLTIAR